MPREPGGGDSEAPPGNVTEPHVEPLDVAIARERTRAALLGSAPQPGVLGRYVLEERRGEGGMGLVLAAFDPLLRRRVAIKLVRTAGIGAEAIAALERQLVREARALARVADSNVVPIFEVGRGTIRAGSESTVYCVMELVDGIDGRAWFNAAPRTCSATLDVLRAAGSGLAAAHRAGVIHCDFKPDNVLVAHDGRVLVADFGLARAVSQAGEKGGTSLVGTAAYLSPQRLEGAEPCIADDVYAFCVSAYEMLHHHRPTRGRDEPGSRRVPRRIDRVLARGLAPRVEHRYPDIAAVLDALERAGRGSSSPGWIAALTGAVATTIILTSDAETGRVCDGEPAAARVWNAERRATIGGAMAATQVPYAERSWTNLEAQVSDWTSAWKAEYADACRSTPPGRRGPEVERRLACLDHDLARLDTLLGGLERAGGEAIEALQPDALLDEPARCRAGDPIPPSSIDAEVAAAEVALDRVEAESMFGDRTAAALLAGEGLAAAEALGHPPTIARALVLRGQIRRRTGEIAGAAEDLEAAYWIASASSSTLVALRAASDLAEVVRELGSDSERALDWTRHAWAAALAAELPPWRLAPIASARAWVHYDTGDLAATMVWMTLALGLASLDPDCASTCIGPTTALGNLSVLLVDLGDVAAGLRLATLVLDVEIAHFGPSHPQVASSQAAIGFARMREGDFERARHHLKRALEIRREVLSADHRLIAVTLNQLAVVEMERGDYSAARGLLEDAFTILEASESTRGRERAGVLANLAVTLREVGDSRGAIAVNERALVEYERAEDPLNLAATLNNIGVAQLDLGEHEPAIVALRRAIAVREGVSGPSDPELAWPLRNLATALVNVDRPHEALPIAERGLELVHDDVAHPMAPALRYELARALWNAEVDRPRAHRLVTDLDATRVDDPALRARIGAWLHAHSKVD